MELERSLQAYKSRQSLQDKRSNLGVGERQCTDWPCLLMQFWCPTAVSRLVVEIISDQPAEVKR